MEVSNGKSLMVTEPGNLHSELARLKKSIIR